MKMETFALGALLLVSPPLHAAPDGSRDSERSIAELEIECSLEQTEIPLGAPMVLSYRLSHAGSVPIWVDFGENRESWVDLSMADPRGSRLPIASVAQANEWSGVSRTQTRLLRERDVEEGKLVISERFKPKESGTFRVDVVFRVPYQTGVSETPPVSLRKSGPGIEEPSGVFTVHRSFNVTITPTDSAQLHEIAARLMAVAVSKDASVRERHTALRALFSMPPSAVKSKWRQLAENPRIGYDIDILVPMLVRIGSIDAADILGDIWASSQHPNRIKSLAHLGLRKMARSSTPEVRDHIDKTILKRSPSSSQERLPTLED